MQKLIISSFLLVTFLNFFNLSLAQILFKKGAPIVKLDQGLYTGIVRSSRGERQYYEFLGIRYAPAPKRFQPPEPFKPSEPETKHVITPGAKCLQGFGPNVLGEEDCLFLNIFLPMKPPPDADGYPVMVWIHGGAFSFSSGESYEPQYFMDEDVILVTINYRLGVFGFLSTEDDVVPGNMGLKDQAMALLWVQNNIGHFGGDKRRVTIFGNSAGAASVHYLMLSPLTKGTFQSAIAQSGSVHSLWAYTHNPLAKADELARLLNCKTESSGELVKCLEGKTAQEIIKAQSNMKRWFIDPITPFGPTVELHQTDSAFLYDLPEIIIERRDFSRVPLMLGIVEDEGLSINSAGVMNSEKLRTQLDVDFDTIAPITFNLKGWFPENYMSNVTKDLRNFYFGKKKINMDSMQNLTNLYSDANFVQGVWKFALEHAAEKPVYPYLISFQDESSSSLTKLFTGSDTKYGVAHGDEIQYMFKSQLFAEEIPKDSESEKFSIRLVKLWASFARHRKPIDTWGSAREWPPISKAQLDGNKPVQWYNIDRDTKLIDEPFLARKKFWDKLFKKYSKKLGSNMHNKDEL